MEYTVIDNFLENWKVEARKYYLEMTYKYIELYETNEFKEWSSKQNPQVIAVIYKITCYGHEDKEKIKNQLEILLTKDVEVKKKAFIKAVEKKAGKIIDASGLYIGVNGSINGKVIGDLKMVSVETIMAGGHTVQCLHYRVLVK